MYINSKRSTIDQVNADLFIELTNSQAMFMIEKEYLFVKHFVDSGFSIFNERELDLYRDSVQKLQNFLWFCNKRRGIHNKSVQHFFTYETIVDVCNVCVKAAEYLGLSETINICNELYSTASSYESIGKLLEDCVSYLIDLLNKNNIDPLVLPSKSSSSLYIKPDVLLSEVRISDHYNPNYSGVYNFICCKDLPRETRTPPTGKCSVFYLTRTNYRSVLDTLVQNLLDEKGKLIKQMSKRDYDKLKYQEMMGEKFHEFKFIQGIKDLSKLFKRKR